LLHGRFALRICVLNHQSSSEDVETVLAFLETAEPEVREPRRERHPAIVSAWPGLPQGRPAVAARAGTATVTADTQEARGLGRGDFFGELRALDWGAGYAYPRLASVRATLPLRLLVLPEGVLARLVERYPSLDRVIREAVAERLPRHS